MLKYYNEIYNLNIREMYLPFSNEKEKYIIPNCYYINSQGLLYNCFGDDGHKESNLTYTYNLIKDPFIVKLIIGIISSKIIMLNRFIELENKSNNKREDIDKIIDLSKDDIKDILVRYCGFHKIESLENKTITTSSLNLNSFINYFDNDWTIDIVPKISIFNENDELYITLVIDNFLEKNPQYSSKINVRKLTLYKGSDLND